jgi:hypothetical protein
MAERNVSRDSAATTLYLVTAIIWGIIFVGSIWLDFCVRHVPLSLWRKFWDFLLTPGLFLANAFIYKKRRSKEPKAI